MFGALKHNVTNDWSLEDMRKRKFRVVLSKSNVVEAEKQAKILLRSKSIFEERAKGTFPPIYITLIFYFFVA